jgi:hypothetical protein
MLLDVKGELSQVCSQSHITYSFHLLRTTGRLNIRFAYSPKRLEDPKLAKSVILEAIRKYTLPEHIERVQSKWESFLPLQNLLTLSVDDPVRHRGAGHRHDQEQLLSISCEDASPGLVRGPLHPGLWKVTISAHAIVTETCRYELQIWQEEG